MLREIHLPLPINRHTLVDGPVWPQWGTKRLHAEYVATWRDFQETTTVITPRIADIEVALGIKGNALGRHNLRWCGSISCRGPGPHGEHRATRRQLLNAVIVMVRHVHVAPLINRESCRVAELPTASSGARNPRGIEAIPAGEGLPRGGELFNLGGPPDGHVDVPGGVNGHAEGSAVRRRAGSIRGC